MLFWIVRRLAAGRLVRSRLALAGGVVVGAVVLAAVTAVPAGASPARGAPARGAPARGAPARVASGGFRAACPLAPAGEMRCYAVYRPQFAVNAALAAGQSAGPAGLTPQQIEAAYRLPVSRRSRMTVAVSIAFNAPDLDSDLAFYRSFFHLPACTTASGCLRIVNQDGRASPLPASGVPNGWALEETLDVSMISVACPRCRILVVEGKNASPFNLGATENTAVRLGAKVISNSYGQRENGAALAVAKDYLHPGHTIVASSGDLGFTAANFPADLANVTAVGGTELTAAPKTGRGWNEQVANQRGRFFAGGSGCSAYMAKPSWQHDARCPGRTVADVAAVAWNVPIYSKDFGGWVTIGGTSVSAPLIAGIYGLAGNAAKIRPGYAYAHAGHLFDVNRGNNSMFVTAAQACGDDYLCVARHGYDAPTGLGTPDGIGAF
ncbi:MAG TPA: S8 family serine peptidase [Streptosporangiaceae bacterium]|nr:S8 family serine peptidase [Streptosporangiaceae bacterium]